MLAQLLEYKTLEDLWFHVGVIALGVIGLRKCIYKDLREVSFGECRNWKVSHLPKSNILQFSFPSCSLASKLFSSDGLFCGHGKKAIMNELKLFDINS